ncbi:MAG: hypothetical protein FJX64_03940 [Alphaproteobacteria bacterium]|nr:hypothetical protein [Alphaproteobacteria bacterium]
MTLGFVGVLAAYVIIAVLLLSLNIAPRWAWWVKATAIVVTSAFFVISYYSMIDLMGWPVRDRLPAKFQLLWAKVNEPDKLLNSPGAVFMWVEALDKNNVPNGIPRAYRLPYTQPLETGIQNALDMITNGQEVGGTAEMYDEAEQRRGQDDQRLAQLQQMNRTDTGYTDPNELRVLDQVLTLGALQNVTLPDKEFVGGAN